MRRLLLLAQQCVPAMCVEGSNTIVRGWLADPRVRLRANTQRLPSANCCLSQLRWRLCFRCRRRHRGARRPFVRGDDHRFHRDPRYCCRSSGASLVSGAVASPDMNRLIMRLPISHFDRHPLDRAPIHLAPGFSAVRGPSRPSQASTWAAMMRMTAPWVPSMGGAEKHATNEAVAALKSLTPWKRTSTCDRLLLTPGEMKSMGCMHRCALARSAQYVVSGVRQHGAQEGADSRLSVRRGSVT